MPWFCSYSDIPSTFLLGVRQHSFELHLTLPLAGQPTSFLSLLCPPQAQSLAVNPFALGSIEFKSLSVTDLLILSRAGRAGPEKVKFSVASAEWGKDSVEFLSELLGRNPWLDWDNDGGQWFREPDEPEQEDDDEIFATEGSLSRLADTFRQRNEDLRNTTRSAVVALL
jgi:hypothetical protein